MLGMIQKINNLFTEIATPGRNKEGFIVSLIISH